MVELQNYTRDCINDSIYYRYIILHKRSMQTAMTDTNCRPSLTVDYMLVDYMLLVDCPRRLLHVDCHLTTAPQTRTAAPLRATGDALLGSKPSNRTNGTVCKRGCI